MSAMTSKNHYHQSCLAVFLTAALLVALASAQSPSGGGSGGGTGGMPSCASKLTGCANYINATTTPPSTCCDPLKEAVTNERECLCNLYKNTALLQAFQINVTQALNLPKLCKIDTGKDANICKDVAPSPSSTGSTPSTPAGSGSGSASTPAGSGSGSSDNAAGVIRTGLVSSLFVLVTCLVFS